MATDVDVQYFSHLNGLTLGNNWGDLIRLLDKALVTGIELTQITSASIDEQGDIHLTLYAAHNCMLFQIIELSDFADVSVDGVSRHINGKYRIKGVPVNNQLILKGIIRTVDNPPIVNLSSLGSAKLASLGYDIVFRDTNDVKRVYRAKDPTAQHPFIRVDESLTSADETTGVYTSTYAKFAMIGLLENMTHIDDYENPLVLQLPFDSADPGKNWKITGTGTSVLRGWCKWYWCLSAGGWNTSAESSAPSAGNRKFTLFGDKNAFYLLNQTGLANDSKFLNGCGLFGSALKSDVIPNWFLMAYDKNTAASAAPNRPTARTGSPLMRYSNTDTDRFLLPRYAELSRIANHTYAVPILPSGFSGRDNLFSASNIPAIEIPFYDETACLRGSLPHVCYSGKSAAPAETSPIPSENSMYISDVAACYNYSNGMFYFYLGELE
jgi:hypothetical protein